MQTVSWGRYVHWDSTLLRHENRANLINCSCVSCAELPAATVLVHAQSHNRVDLAEQEHNLKFQGFGLVEVDRPDSRQ